MGILMVGLSNFNDAFLILEEVMKHPRNRNTSSLVNLYLFFFYSCFLCAERVFAVYKTQREQRILRGMPDDFQNFCEATAHIV